MESELHHGTVSHILSDFTPLPIVLLSFWLAHSLFAIHWLVWFGDSDLLVVEADVELVFKAQGGLPEHTMEGEYDRAVVQQEIKQILIGVNGPNH